MDSQFHLARSTSRLGVACLLMTVLLMGGGGCTAKYYHSQADQQVYGILQAVERDIFGHTNVFSIDTAYSARGPDTIFAPEIIDDRMATNRRTLSLDEALNLAVENSRSYQMEKENLYLAALSLTGSLHEFGPQFFGGTGAEYRRFADGDRRGSWFSSLGVSQMLKTGGLLTASLANSVIRYYTGDARESVVSTISVNLMQPLLRNFGKNNPAVEGLTQSERDVVYEVRSFSHFQNEFAIGIVNSYFELLALKNVIRNNYSNYLSQVQSTKRLEARSRDRESINAVDLARQSELSAKDRYINSVAAYFNRLDLFKLELGLALNERLFLDDSELEKLEGIGLIPVQIDGDQAFRLATERQLEILNSIDRFEDAKRKVRLLASQLKAGLDFEAGAGLASEPPTDYTNFDIDDINYFASIELDLPLDRLSERNAYRNVLVAFERVLRGLALDLDELKDDINGGLRTLEQRRQNYLIQQNALELANRRVHSNQLLLQAGRAEVRDLVEAQNAQINAQNAVIASLVSYQETRLQLLHIIGVIETQSDNFWFKGHLENTPEIVAVGKVPLDLPREELLTPDQIFSR